MITSPPTSIQIPVAPTTAPSGTAQNVTPINLTPVNGAIQFRGPLNTSQVSAFQSLLESSGLIAFPSGKTAADLVSFSINLVGPSAGIIQVGLN